MSIYVYLYLSISIYIYLYLSISIYIYLYLSISIYIYLYLSISIYIYLYLSISIYVYLYLSIYPCVPGPARSFVRSVPVAYSCAAPSWRRSVPSFSASPERPLRNCHGPALVFDKFDGLQAATVNHWRTIGWFSLSKKNARIVRFFQVLW